MKIAITQPNFIPWLGFFDLIDRIDIFVSLDNVQNVTRSFIVRNKVQKTDNEPVWLSVNLKKAKQETLINETILDDDKAKYDKIINRISDYYQKAPFFNEYFDFVKEVLLPQEQTLSKYNLRIIKEISHKIGIITEFKEASSIIANIEGTPEEIIMGICKKLEAKEFYNFQKGVELGLYKAENFAKENMKLFKQEYNHPIYKQSNDKFTPYLSIIDLLFYEGKEALSVIRKGRNWIEM